MLEKISAAQVDHIMTKAASTIRAQDARIRELEFELARRDRVDHAEKIASEAVNRGMMDIDEAEAYASDLANSQEDLKMVEDFVSRAAAGVPLGKTLEKVASDSSTGSGEADVLTSFLLSSEYSG